MFTGIVEKAARVTHAKRVDGSLAVTIGKPVAWKFKPGDSIAVDGVCLTVTKSLPRSFSAVLMPETLRKTTGALWTKGRVVNLERPLTLGDRLHGHVLQGHVAGTALISAIKREGTSKLITFKVPGALLTHVRLHGSLAINGVSLTAARIHGPYVSVALIPYTLSHTNLGTIRKGDRVNVETDFLLRGTVRPNATTKKRARTGGKRRVEARSRRHRLPL